MSKSPKPPKLPFVQELSGLEYSPLPPLRSIGKSSSGSRQSLTPMAAAVPSSGSSSPPPDPPISNNTYGGSVSPSPLAALKDGSLSGKASTSPASAALSARSSRSTHKTKSRDIVKPSPAVYESADGPLIRVTQPEILRIFQTKIADTNATTSGMFPLHVSLTRSRAYLTQCTCCSLLGMAQTNSWLSRS